MGKRKNEDLIVALDVGTSKTVALIGEITEEDTIQVIGIGNYASRGLKRGVVVNIEATSQSIQKAIEDAETMAECQVHDVLTTISGNHIHSLNSNGIVAVKTQQVEAIDVDGVIEAACAVPIPTDQKVLHVIPQQFIIDNQDSIKSPIGMSGVRLEANVHLIIGNSSSADNIRKCVENCSLEVSDLVLSPLASAQALLTEDEKELGVCLVDIGAGTTDIMIFINGAIHHTAVVALGGDQITNDIAVVLRIPTQQAEALKVNFACALRRLTNPEEVVDIPDVVNERASKKWTKQNLAEVVEPRYEEIMQFIKQEIQQSGLEEQIGAGIVFTGGSSKMQGVVELAEEIFHLPVRLGVAKHIEAEENILKDPSYSTALGLLLVGNSEDRIFSPIGYKKEPEKTSVWKNVASWFKGNF